MFAYLIQGLILGFPAAATPGPLQAYFLSQTMRAGWRRTIPAAFAPLLSDGPIILLVLFVLTRTPDWFLRGLRFVGGAFFIYLAYVAYRKLREKSNEVTLSIEDSDSSLWKAVFTNLLNPNPYLFWSLVAGPILIGAWRESVIYGLGFLLGFYGVLVGGFVLLITIFATARKVAPPLIRWLNLIAVAALFFFGLYQIWSGITG